MKNIFFLFLNIVCWQSGIHAQRPPVRRQLTVSTVLQSKMVIQQNKPFKVWGTALPGERVSVKADWLSGPVSVQANEAGRYLAILEVPAAGKGDYREHSLSVSAGAEKIELKHLLIGDIWFCSGQSNMQFAVHEMSDSVSQLATANRPGLRLLNVALNFSAAPTGSITGSWSYATPATVSKFSAVGYVFGKTLQQHLDIPVGLIFSGIGASKVQAFLPREVLHTDSLLDVTYLQPYLNSPHSREVIDKSFTFEKVTRPYLLYNALIHPFLNLSIKGFCWYQGESNNRERAVYTRATIAMIEAWRHAFGQGDLPFEYVQIAPFGHDTLDPGRRTDAFFREAQQKIMKLSNTMMVSTMDVGDKNNLHPKKKKPVGERLAMVALNRTYGWLQIPYQGPAFDYMQIRGDSVTIHFTPQTLAGGLRTRDGSAPRFFELCGSDRHFYPAVARIAVDAVTVRADQVRHPVAVRYAFFNYPVTNLENGAGFPALPFRTDDWPEDAR